MSYIFGSVLVWYGKDYNNHFTGKISKKAYFAPMGLMIIFDFIYKHNAPTELFDKSECFYLKG
jgi:hypothetical protein